MWMAWRGLRLTKKQGQLGVDGVTLEGVGAVLEQRVEKLLKERRDESPHASVRG